ncbi:MAG: restriction endonuclease, partial [bacterium]
MNDLIIYHYPPELMSLLIDTIPLLQKSKIDVVTFFRGAGVSELLLTDIRQQLTRDSSTINKYEITRRVLKNINEGADKTIKARREILKRVVEFENFDSCWPDDRLKAKGLVASIRELINVKDTFTKINNELDRTRVERIRLQKEKDDKLNNYRQESECLKNDFFALFSLNDPYKRGKTLETVINRLFQ